MHVFFIGFRCEKILLSIRRPFPWKYEKEVEKRLEEKR